MSKRKPDWDEMKARRQRAREWRELRRRCLLTQVELAAMLGCCERTVQSVESLKSTPLAGIQRKFAVLRNMHLNDEKAAA